VVRVVVTGGSLTRKPKRSLRCLLTVESEEGSIFMAGQTINQQNEIKLPTFRFLIGAIVTRNTYARSQNVILYSLLLKVSQDWAGHYLLSVYTCRVYLSAQTMTPD